MRTEVDLDGREVVIVGTSHVSEQSRQEVVEAVDEVEPDLVAVELDGDRLKSLREDSGWRDLDVAEAIMDGKGYHLALNLFLSILQRRIGGELEPGAEMLQAVKLAEERGLEYELVDRDINDTFSSLRDQMGLWEKLKLGSSVLESSEEFELEDVSDSNVVDRLVEELRDEYPALGRVFLDERNAYMAERIREAEFERCVAVVGAAHAEGLAEQLRDPSGVPVPGRGFPVMKLVKWGIPALAVLGIPYIFLQIGTEEGIRASTIWIGLNGVLAALGAIAARSHPLTWLTSFVAAPLTSLYPALGAGMVAPYVEAKLRPPSVGELEDIAELDSYRELWGNQAGRIVLTFLFVTLGSAVASFLAGGAIASMIA